MNFRKKMFLYGFVYVEGGQEKCIALVIGFSTITKNFLEMETIQVLAKMYYGDTVKIKKWKNLPNLWEKVEIYY